MKPSQDNKAKADFEDADWEDTGCDFECACLDCERPQAQCPDINRNVFIQERMKQQLNEVIDRMLAGQSNAQICKEMGISERTIYRALKRERK